MKKIILLAVFATSLFLGTTLRVEAGESELTLQLQSQIEQKVLSMVHPYDPSALIFVRAYFKTENTSLPGTPFFAKDITVQEVNGTAQLSKVLIVIMSQKKPFSQIVLDTAKKILETQNIPAVFQVDELPAEMKPIEEVKPIPDSANTGVWKEGVDQLKYVFRVLVGMAVVMLIAAAVDLTRRDNSALLKLLEEGISKLTSSESRSEARESKNLRTQDTQEVPSIQNPAPSASVNQEWDQYTDESIQTCLSDCYWCDRDSYANFIWKQLGSSRKKTLLEGSPFLAAYASYFSTLPAKNEAWIEDLAYLSPLPVNQVSNEDLGSLLKEQPSLFGALSRMRQTALPLRLKDRIMLSRLETRSAEEFKELKKIKASALRNLRKRLQITLQTIEEEEELLGFSPFSLELAEDIPSLGWLVKLPAPTQTKILEKYSARDLASAWIGPEKVLETLKSAIPETKFSMIESYLKSVSGSRTSAAYLDIHKTTLLALQTQNQGQEPKQGQQTTDTLPERNSRAKAA